LKKHLRLSYKIEGLRRENILELPEDALREAVVNAVCRSLCIAMHNLCYA
jgi:predicted HTH transcriptional regulator